MISRRFLLTLLAAATMASGCIDTKTVPVSYGPAVEESATISARVRAIGPIDPLAIKVGEFTARGLSQDLAYGASFSVIGDTGITITERNEDPNKVVYNGVIHDIQYQQDGTYSKVSREGEIGCVSKVAGGCGEAVTTDVSQASASATKPTIVPGPGFTASNSLISFQSIDEWLGKRRVDSLKYTSAEKLIMPLSVVPAPTFHHLMEWTTHESPPSNVAAQPNCLGIAGCGIDIKHVAYDQVFWDDPRGIKMHVEYQYSPQVPYLSNQVSVCQSVLVDLNASSNILLKQCSNVFDFRFESN